MFQTIINMFLVTIFKPETRDGYQITDDFRVQNQFDDLGNQIIQQT